MGDKNGMHLTTHKIAAFLQEYFYKYLPHPAGVYRSDSQPLLEGLSSRSQSWNAILKTVPHSRSSKQTACQVLLGRFN